MKKCGGPCGEEKSEHLFSINRKKKDGLNGQCKSCHSAYRKDHYRKNKVKLLSQIEANKTKVRESFIKELATKQCHDCGNTDVRVLEYDHVGVKTAGVSSLLYRSAVRKLEKEIKECEIVCANCHHIRTCTRSGNLRQRIWASLM